MSDIVYMQGYSVPQRAVVNVTTVDMSFDIVAEPPRTVYVPPAQTIQRLINEAEKLWEIEPSSVKSSTRRKQVAHARFAVVYAARRMTRPKRSYPEIGRLIGGRDHSTIISAERRAVDLRKTDPDFASLLASLMMTVWRTRRFIAG